MLVHVYSLAGNRVKNDKKKVTETRKSWRQLTHSNINSKDASRKCKTLSLQNLKW